MYYLGNNPDVKLRIWRNREWEMKYEITLKLSTFLTLFTRAGILKSVYLKIYKPDKQTGSRFYFLLYDNNFWCSFNAQLGKKILRSRGTCDENKHGYPIFLLHLLQRPIHGCQLCQVWKIWKLLTSFSRECITSRGHVTLFATF